MNTLATIREMLPPHLFTDAGVDPRLAAPQQLIEVLRGIVADRGLELIADGRAIAPRVEHGRWLADCPECTAGMAIHPDADGAVCVECGHAFAITVPAAGEIAEAEDALCVRSIINRNWDPGRETAQDLRAENALRGFIPRASLKNEVDI